MSHQKSLGNLLAKLLLGFGDLESPSGVVSRFFLQRIKTIKNEGKVSHLLKVGKNALQSEFGKVEVGKGLKKTTPYKEPPRLHFLLVLIHGKLRTRCVG